MVSHIKISFLGLLLPCFLSGCSIFNGGQDLSSLSAEKDYEAHIEQLSSHLRSQREVLRSLKEENQVLKIKSSQAAQILNKSSEKTEDSSVYQILKSEPLSVTYRKLIKSYKARDFKEVQRFAENLEALHPKHDFTGQALYWLGSSYYQEENYVEALRAYDRLLKNFPQNKKIPNAYLGKALIYEKLDLPSVSRSILERVQREFEETPFAKRAHILEKKLRR